MTDAPASYDVAAIRSDFPILSRQIYGKPLVYLDNGASAQKPKVVLDAIMQAYGHEYANVHRGLHYLSNTATQHFAQRTHGWAPVFGGGLEVWASKKVAIFSEMSISRIKGKAEDKGDGEVDDRLRYFGIGLKIRLSR